MASSRSFVTFFVRTIFFITLSVLTPAVRAQQTPGAAKSVAPAPAGPRVPNVVTPDDILPSPAPAVTTTVGPGAPDKKIDDKVPKAATVKETEPSVAPPVPAPATEAPTLSAPAPNPVIVPPTRYFVMIFGAESVPKRGRFSHTWMTVVKATPKASYEGDYDPASGNQIKYYDVLAHTISWMPASLRIRVIKFRPECGVNLDLHTSLRYCMGQCEKLAMYGPYELNPTIAEEVYNKTLKQIAKLKSGRVLYKSLDPDSGPQLGWVVDCIHAVSDLDGPHRRGQYLETQHFGWDGAAVIARSLVNANRVDPTTRHMWVGEALQLNCYPLCILNMQPCRPPMAAIPVTAHR